MIVDYNFVMLRGFWKPILKLRRGNRLFVASDPPSLFELPPSRYALWRTGWRTRPTWEGNPPSPRLRRTSHHLSLIDIFCWTLRRGVCMVGQFFEKGL
jgi:hypothetical protein